MATNLTMPKSRGSKFIALIISASPLYAEHQTPFNPNAMVKAAWFSYLNLGRDAVPETTWSKYRCFYASDWCSVLMDIQTVGQNYR